MAVSISTIIVWIVVGILAGTLAGMAIKEEAGLWLDVQPAAGNGGSGDRRLSL